MRILINGLSARIGGGVTFIQNILPALARLDRQHTFILVLSPRYQCSLIETVPLGMKVIQVDLPAEPLARRWWYLQTALPHLLNELQVDLFFAPCEGSYFRIPTSLVMMARNSSIYASVDSFGNQRLRLLLRRLIRQPLVFLSLQRADRVVFVSASFRDKIVRQMRVSMDKARVVHHGLSPIFWQPAARSKLLPSRQTYFLSVSTINPHKNYETLLRAYAHLPVDAPCLVIAGKPANESTYHQLRMLVASEGIEKRVHFLGAVPYEKLPPLYQGAIASVFPSRLETFGHPLVEAMASGTPVIASDLPVCREICQDAALYFTPDDPGRLATHMRQLMDDTRLRESLAQRGQTRARDFSWDESARKLVEVFEELV